MRRENPMAKPTQYRVERQVVSGGRWIRTGRPFATESEAREHIRELVKFDTLAVAFRVVEDRRP